MPSYPGEHDTGWYSDPDYGRSGQLLEDGFIGEDCCDHGVSFDEDCEECEADAEEEEALMKELEEDDAE